MRWLVPILALTLAPAVARADATCGDGIVRAHAPRLAPWTVASVSTDPAGLVAVLERPDAPDRLLLGMRVEPRGLVTVQSLWREHRHAPVPPDAIALLGPFWDAVDQDPRSRQCLDLAAGQGLPDAATFAALDRAADRLQAARETISVPPPPREPDAAPARPNDARPAGLQGVLHAGLAYAVLLGPALLVFAALRRRERGLPG